MEFVSQRGGGYYKYPNNFMDESIEIFMITENAEMKKVGDFIKSKEEIDVRYPTAKVPGGDASVWDFAYFFCMIFCWTGNNKSERSMLDALASEKFIKVCESVQIMDWDGMHWDMINLFDLDNHRDLARNAHYYAHKVGVITTPDGGDRFTEDFLRREKRIKFEQKSYPTSKDIF